MLKYYLILLISILLNSASLILLKKGAVSRNKLIVVDLQDNIFDVLQLA